MIERRFKWLINLRWLAASGVFIATLLINLLFDFDFSQIALYSIAGLLLLSNILYTYMNRRASRVPGKRYVRQERLVIVQIIGDLILLTALLHFSGGVENPFIIYYVFHMMLAGILLSRRMSFLITSFAIFLVGVLAAFEYLGWLPHYSLKGFLTDGFYHNLTYLIGTGFVFITTSYVVVYMTSTVSAYLRKRESEYRRANEELREKDTIKDEYVFRITHDIKGHLSAIKNCLDASLTDLPPEQQKSFTQRAYERTHKLLDFIRELLRITKLRLNNEMVFSRFSLQEVVEDILSVFEKPLAEKNIKIDLQLGIKDITADKLAISEAITNLVSNSLKFTNPGGKIRISSIHQKNNKIRIEVTDSGVGIDPGEVKYVFREFYKASNNKDRIKDGTGMGLTIVRMIMEQHDGQVKVSSKLNEGTSFTLELPDRSKKRS